jgi:hypothetical protein
LLGNIGGHRVLDQLASPQVQNALFWGFLICIALSLINPFHLVQRTRRIVFWVGIALFTVDLLMQFLKPGFF